MSATVSTKLRRRSGSQGFAAHLPMKRMGAMDDIADAILFLASDEASYITGQEVIVDGGYVVR